jgi:hypothetical protein
LVITNSEHHNTCESKMYAEDMTNQHEMGECLLVAQEVQGKSDVWNNYY